LGILNRHHFFLSLGKLILSLFLRVLSKNIMTRTLSRAEITFILENADDYIPKFLPENMRRGFLERMVAPLRSQLEKVSVVDHPDVVSTLREKIHESIQRCVVQPGEGVGVICAQSIGERQTQLTLNSFHQSGLSVATVVTGVPRFLELLNATKDPKMSSNQFRLRSRETNNTPYKVRKVLSHHIVHVSMADLVVRDTICEEKDEEVWYGAFETVYSNRFRDYHACLSFELDLKKMHQYRITPMRIAEKLEAQFTDVCCVFSPLHIGQMDVFVDVSQVALPEGVPSFLTPTNYIRVFLEDIVKIKVLETKICGLNGIRNYHILKNDEGGLYVDTEGSHLEGIVALPFVDISSVRSNNMWDVYHVMGIEATREFLVEEFTSIVSSDGTFLNPVHILLLVDIMTHHGTINSVSRYGLKKEQVGVLSRSSFEESLDHFCNAAFYAEKEPVKAVSAAIMCGKRSKIGSGLCSLLMDWSSIAESTTQTFPNTRPSD